MAAADTAWELETLVSQIDRVLVEDKKLCDGSMQVLGDIYKGNDMLKGFLLLSGSYAEGCCLSRCFTGGAAESCREVELDIMHTVATIPTSEQCRVEDAEVYSAHVRFPYDLVSSHICTPHIERKFIEYLQRTKGRAEVNQMQKYLNPFMCRDFCRRFFNFKDSRGIRWDVIATLFEVDPATIIIDVEQGTTGASANTKFSIQMQDSSLLDFSIDSVPAIKLDSLPEVVEPWLLGFDRNRKWPSQDVIEVMASNGCHAVPKTAEGGDEETDWRLSFSTIEMQLAAMRNKNPNVKRSYFLFKTIFYQHLKELDLPTAVKDAVHKKLSSYLCKTTMMWVCERHSPLEDELWQEDNLLNSVDHLLGELQEYLQEGVLPHYFIPCCNLIDDVPEIVRVAAVGKLTDIRGDLMHHLPSNMESVAVMAADFCEKLARAKDVWVPKLIGAASVMRLLQRINCEDSFKQ